MPNSSFVRVTTRFVSHNSVQSLQPSPANILRATIDRRRHVPRIAVHRGGPAVHHGCTAISLTCRGGKDPRAPTCRAAAHPRGPLHDCRWAPVEAHARQVARDEPPGSRRRAAEARWRAQGLGERLEAIKEPSGAANISPIPFSLAFVFPPSCNLFIITARRGSSSSKWGHVMYLFYSTRYGGRQNKVGVYYLEVQSFVLLYRSSSPLYSLHLSRKVT